MGQDFDRAKATEEIRRIIFSYPNCIDRGDIDGAARVLTGVKMSISTGILAPEVPEDEMSTLSFDDAREMHTSTMVLYEDGTPHTKHVISNIDVSFADDARTASSRCSYTVLQQADDFPLQVVVAGRCEDIYEFDGKQWKLRVRREYADMMGNLSHHVKPEVIARLAAQGQPVGTSPSDWSWS
jgi:SnoaL-like domain